MAFYKGASAEGQRAMHLIKKRQQQHDELEKRKKKLEEETETKGNIDKKFAAHYDAIEQQLKSETVGLVTLDEMKAKQEDAVKERMQEIARKEQAHKDQLKKEKEEKRLAKEKRKKQIASLSFNPFGDEEEEEEDEDGDDEEKEKKKDEDEGGGEKEGEKEPEAGTSEESLAEESTSEQGKESTPIEGSLVRFKREFEGTASEDSDDGAKKFEKKKKKFGKNPDVDTSFLPDRDREDEDNAMREKLRQEWVERQEKMKAEEISITFSYWDGSGHRRVVKMKKGNSISQFLQKGLDSLRKEFNELKTCTVDNLMFIKEDLIIPHHYTFYDFIVTKARGKSGPLFTFDVVEDIRMVNDATVEKEDAHPGKVCLRSWYERHKHIFPASRWEPFDPTKKWNKYTIHDRDSPKITVK